MKKNVLKTVVLLFFIAGALTATLTGSVNDVSTLQNANFDDGYDSEISKPSDYKMLLAVAYKIKRKEKEKRKVKNAL